MSDLNVTLIGYLRAATNPGGVYAANGGVWVQATKRGVVGANRISTRTVERLEADGYWAINDRGYYQPTEAGLKAVADHDSARDRDLTTRRVS